MKKTLKSKEGKSVKSLNNKLYSNLPIDELESRLQLESLEERLELGTWCKRNGSMGTC